jgi:hypothetical protein
MEHSDLDNMEGFFLKTKACQKYAISNKFINIFLKETNKKN